MLKEGRGDKQSTLFLWNWDVCASKISFSRPSKFIFFETKGFESSHFLSFNGSRHVLNIQYFDEENNVLHLKGIEGVRITLKKMSRKSHFISKIREIMKDSPHLIYKPTARSSYGDKLVGKAKETQRLQPKKRTSENNSDNSIKRLKNPFGYETRRMNSDIGKESSPKKKEVPFSSLESLHRSKKPSFQCLENSPSKSAYSCYKPITFHSESSNNGSEECGKFKKSSSLKLDSKSDDLSFGMGGGFRNEGNTCYINSVLQALTSISPFVQEFEDSFSEESFGES